MHNTHGRTGKRAPRAAGGAPRARDISSASPRARRHASNSIDIVLS